MERVMKILPLFIVLLLFSAAIILSYMGWTAFKGREDHFLVVQKGRSSGVDEDHNYKKSQPFPNIPLIGDGDQIFDNLNQKKEANPNDPENEGLPPGLITVNEDILVDPDLMRKVDLLKMKVISKLRRHILDGAKIKGHINEYGVDFSKLKPKSQRIDRKEVLCRIKNTKFNLVDQNSSPLFKENKFPNEPLFGVDSKSGGEKSFFAEQISPEPLYKSCAVIPNSAAFDGAQHGIDIDSHDFILRFNNAPTAGYEDDVGSLTSLRLVNSQVVTKPQFQFPSSAFYKKKEKVELQSDLGSDSETEGEDSDKNTEATTKVETETKSNAKEGWSFDNNDIILDSLWESTRKYLIWDPCGYSSNLEQWYNKPDFPIFDKYFNLTSQSQRERNRFYLMDCRVIWRLWEILQEYSFVKIYGNPPTSGFIGIMLSLQLCERVNVYEYIPSIRESTRCHYYSPKNESNPSCTYGSWHPVSAEKLFFLSISDGTDKQIFLDGILTLPGVSKFHC